LSLDDPVSASSDWEFYHAGESKRRRAFDICHGEALRHPRKLTGDAKPLAASGSKSVDCFAESPRGSFTVQVARAPDQADALNVACAD